MVAQRGAPQRWGKLRAALGAGSHCITPQNHLQGCLTLLQAPLAHWVDPEPGPASPGGVRPGTLQGHKGQSPCSAQNLTLHAADWTQEQGARSLGGCPASQLGTSLLDIPGPHGKAEDACKVLAEGDKPLATGWAHAPSNIWDAVDAKWV